ncbi:MAG: hypothetical protein H0V29_00560 [Thermoleophilaceae bacterium]|nr:hypothetical protein [Thermoleophilaceae bacterium]
MEGPYATSAIEDLPQLWDGFAKLVREGLGVSGFGAQIMDLPPDYQTKSHDESDSGQEELYLALSGSGTSRTLTSGSGGLRVLCVGGTPGKPYEAPEWSEG